MITNLMMSPARSAVTLQHTLAAAMSSVAKMVILIFTNMRTRYFSTRAIPKCAANVGALVGSVGVRRVVMICKGHA